MINSVLIGVRCACKHMDSLIDGFVGTVYTHYHCSLHVSVLDYASVYSACTHMQTGKRLVMSPCDQVCAKCTVINAVNSLFADVHHCVHKKCDSLNNQNGTLCCGLMQFLML